MKKTLIATAAVAMLALTGCSSDADVAGHNLSKAAEQFEVQRKIVGINGITDTPAFVVQGRCSIETAESSVKGSLAVICKHGPDDFRKHYLGLSDNTYWVATQMDGIDVSEYHTRILIKPENIVPNFDLETSGE